MSATSSPSTRAQSNTERAKRKVNYRYIIVLNFRFYMSLCTLWFFYIPSGSMEDTTNHPLHCLLSLFFFRGIRNRLEKCLHHIIRRYCDRTFLISEWNLGIAEIAMVCEAWPTRKQKGQWALSPTPSDERRTNIWHLFTYI